MEENNVELYDYLRVIWKRKILIIVMILVGIVVGVGVGVVNSRSKLAPVTTYQASAIVKIGKKVRIMSASSITFASSVVEYIENPGQLVETIPLKYGSTDSGYNLNVKRIGTLAMLNLSLNGSDKEGVERALGELVDRLVDEHRSQAKDSVVAYKGFMERLEKDANIIRENVTKNEVSIERMKEKEGEYLVNIESSKVGTKGNRDGGDRSAFLNMLYLKTIDKERELSLARKDLRNIQWQLIMHRVTLGNLEEYKTEMIGKIKNVAIEPNEKTNIKRPIILAGLAGLIASLFIVFFMEYIEETKSRRKKENGKVNSV
jgi:hypothetical protein